ncbi:MAG: hypothetical protein GF411_11035 [Candidatus Lokiarchaeota archaeon]|nr:hypothetical protein [Candidatus Lokiarchaeota archaeon]
MTEYYLDIETLGVNPERNKLITIQYQQLDTKTGKPTGPLTILKEWESSEKEMLRDFLDIINPDNAWDFIPVGYNLRFELYFLQARLRKILKLDLSDEWLYYDLPRIDVKSTIVMMNKGQFKGSSLEWFTKSELHDSQVSIWYARKEYHMIEEYIKDAANRFLHAYQYLKIQLPILHEGYSPSI